MSESQGDADQIKPQEISSSLQDKSKNETPPKKVKGGFRKKIAGGLISSVALASTLTPISGDSINSQNPNSILWINHPEISQSISTQDLEQRAEDLYQIRIVEPEESRKVKGISEDVETTQWDKEMIVKLENSLGKLPPHFYSPAHSIYRVELPKMLPKPENMSSDTFEWSNKNLYDFALDIFREEIGEDFFISREDYEKARSQGYFEKDLGENLPASFFLASLPKFQNPVLGELQGVGICNCDNHFPSNILLDNKALENSSQKDVLGLITHELVHRITRIEDYDFIKTLLEVPSDANFNDFLSVNIENLPKNMDFSVRFALSYGTTNPNEFISVASEFYIHDREYFLKNYTLLIGQDKSEQLYDFMRDKIFKGQEYQKGEKVIS